MDTNRSIQSRNTLPAENVVFEILANPQRRALLRHLIDEGPVVRASELAERLAAPDADGESDAHTVDQQTTALVHTHLPKLAAADLVDWEPGDRYVGVTPQLDGLTLTTPITGNFLDTSVSTLLPRD